MIDTDFNIGDIVIVVGNSERSPEYSMINVSGVVTGSRSEDYFIDSGSEYNIGIWKKDLKLVAHNIAELCNVLNKASDDYYNRGNSELTDAQFDSLYDTLKRMEVKTKIIMANSPTRNVGAPVVDKIDEVKHNHLMLSLDKVHSADEIIKFCSNNDVLFMLKMDGLTVSATYNDGKLTRLETRGDGVSGKNIIHLASAFENLPAEINAKGEYIIDGEAVITYEDFNKINDAIKNADDKYKNPRNLAAGSLNLQDCTIAKTRHLKFIAWDVIKEPKQYNYLNNKLTMAKILGFDIVPYVCVQDYGKMLNSEMAAITLDTLKNAANEKGYPIDGIVIKYDNVEYGASLGRTDKFFRNAIAYKFEDERYPTKLKDIVWQVGKTGTITPVIIVDPIDIDGSTVERASVHNISIFKSLHLTNGCTCYLYKANSIIPQCDSADDDGSGEIQIPEVCPVCGGKTHITRNNDSETLVCSNPECPGKLLGRAKHFVGKKGMDIEGLSEATLEKFIDLGWINNLYDIYNLYEYFPRLKTMTGFGKNSVEKLAASIEASKDVELKNFIAALSIPDIGSSQSKVIAQKMKTWDEFAAAGMGTYDFSQISGIGPVLNANIHHWFRTMYYYDNVEQLAAMMRFKTENANSGSQQPLKDKTFVITGSLKHFSNRDELKEKIESLGGKVSGSISAKTSFLINNDINSNSSKNNKAKSLNIPIITEEEFLNIIET